MALALAWAFAAHSPASAVVIKAGDGTGNTTPPADDPGLAWVGSMNNLSGVYLGNGWIITASHVGSLPIVLGGVTYDHVAGSKHRLTTPGVGLADLALLKIVGDPGLPDLPIATNGPSLSTQVVMHGHGRNRGDAVTWQGTDGWSWGLGHAFRWGTNRVAGVNQTVSDTRVFLTSFDQNGPGVGSDEAQAALGDSGGAVFFKSAGSWVLGGIMFAVGKNAPEQPDDYVLFDNLTLAADLSVYRSEILSVIGQPACDDGLDEDGDGLVDYPADPGCASPTDTDERDPALVCDDGLDQDGDGLVDWPADPGCADSTDAAEQSPDLLCDDGLDNDGDGLVDHPQDPDCGGDPLAPGEAPPPTIPVTSALGAALLAFAVGRSGHAGARRRAEDGACAAQSSSSRTL